MAELIADDKPLPLFRKDLELFEGPIESDGSPTFNLYDPVKAKYFKLSWPESLIVQHLKQGMTLDELHQYISEKTTLKVSKDEIKFFFIDAFRHDLLAVMKSPDYYEQIHDSKDMGVLKWLLFNYLYIRLPLVNPDPFLSKTINFVRPLGSKIAFAIYGFLSLVGILLLLTRFSEFISTFTYFFNFEGIILYAVAISCVKVIHELSHAYTAKNYGVYVPSMGIALIVLWPVLYTDVTDGWKLKNRRERFFISAAGIIAELIVAGLCTIGWYYSPKGIVQSIFFVIASITWVSTLVINLNPAIRFDGYYILGDLWGIDNLQHRAFNVTRWKLREWLLGLKTPPPEERLTHQRITGMIVYSIYTWIYRVFLYTAIALFVYYKFTKALGVFLFCLEIAVFLIWPISSEIRALASLKQYLQTNPRMMFTVTLILAALGWFIIPLPHVEKFPAITTPVEQQLIYVPIDSVVKKIYVERDQQVTQGEPIMELVSPQLSHEVLKLDYEKKILEKQIYLLSFYDSDRAYIPERRAKLSSNNERLYGLKSKKKELDVNVNVPGTVYLWDQELKEGMFLAKDTIVGKIANTKQIEVIAFIPEVDAHIISKDQEITFRVPSTNDLFPGKVVSINPVREVTLQYFPLASVYKGDLPVSKDPQTGQLRMVESYYTVKIELETPEAQLRFGQTGVIEVQGPWRSKLGSLFQSIMRIFWRESGV
ncbi:MAG: efflux RND transporter periplasmic adaptor subunit [Chlamydiota bacterium]|nr:efflux RND transporter periplasmic adaptor subunit [Chlamydiota bacterium]